MHYQEPPIITVDCGTAVTINAVSEDRLFLGGLIFAGINTQLFGLFKQAAGIPELSFVSPTVTVGANTQDSLMAGIVASVVGGIMKGVENIQKEHFGGRSIPVIVTGGEGPLIVDELKANGLNARYEQQLVTTGILRLIASARGVDLQDGIIEKIRN
jgi:type III pantothenate kinase